MNRFSKLATGALSVSMLLAVAQKSSAQVILRVDGQDERNLASEGNHATVNANVQYAFTFGSVAAQNGADGGANPAGTISDFNYTGTGNGGIGFGIDDTNVTVGPSDYLEVSVTSNTGNVVGSLTAELKQDNGDGFQFSVPLGAVGTTVDDFIPLTAVGYNDGGSDSSFQTSPLSQLQLQYPYNAGTAMNVTVHYIQIDATPEPASLGLLSLVGLVGLRRRR